MARTSPPRRRWKEAGPATPTSRSRNRRRGPGSEKKRLEGLWQDGKWWCNCEPRKEAALREVKKDTPNKGRFFWCCATYPFCDFFLWRDDAGVREHGLASVSEANAEPNGGQAQHVQQEQLPPSATPSFTQRPLESFGVQSTPSRRLFASGDDDGGGMSASKGPSGLGNRSSGGSLGSTQTVRADFRPGAAASPSTPSSKRKRNSLNDDGDDASTASEDFGDLDSDEERQLVDIADRSAQKATAGGSFTTPTASRTADIVAGLPTPSVSRTLFPTSDTAKRVGNAALEDAASPGDVFSTPSAKSSLQQETPSSSPSDSKQDVTREVMLLLRDQNVDPTALSSIHGILENAARKAEGISRGREAARAALKQKDGKIAELQARIVAMENKDKVHHKQMTNIKAQLMRMYEDN